MGFAQCFSNSTVEKKRNSYITYLKRKTIWKEWLDPLPFFQHYDIIIGKSLENFSGSYLPTKRDILKRYRLIRSGSAVMDKHQVAKEIVEEMLVIWDRTKIPLKDLKGSAREVSRFIERFRTIKPEKRENIDYQVLFCSRGWTLNVKTREGD